MPRIVDSPVRPLATIVALGRSLRHDAGVDQTSARSPLDAPPAPSDPARHDHDPRHLLPHALGLDVSIAEPWLGVVRTREIARELLEVYFETMTWPEADAIPVRVAIADGHRAAEWTVTFEGEAERVAELRSRILRQAGVPGV